MSNYLEILQIPPTPFFTHVGDDMMHDQTPLYMNNLIDQVVFILSHFSKQNILFSTMFL